MPEHVATIRFANQADADRYTRLMADEGDWLSWLQKGAEIAHQGFVSGLHTGLYGETEPKMRAGLERMLKACFGSRREDGALALDDDQRFMLRLGFEAVALPAMEAALAAVNVANALYGAAAVMDSLNAALLNLTRSAAAPTASHVLAVGPAPKKRPLRPEDFGCLPRTSEPSSMPWADRVRRAAEHPSRGVGPIHGSGEP